MIRMAKKVNISKRPRHTLTGAFELLPKSYGIIKQNFEVFMVLFSVSALFAIWDTLQRLGNNAKPDNWKDYLVSGVTGPSYNTTFYAAAGGFIGFLTIAYLITYLILVIATLRGAQGHRLTLGSLWREFVNNWLWIKLLATMILMALAIVVGLFLLIVPGVILLWRLYLVPYILVDQKTDISEAFARSWEMTRGYGAAIYSIILVTILLSLTKIVPVIGSLAAFVLTSAYIAAPAIRYSEINRRK